MPLTPAQIRDRVGSRHPVVNFEYPPQGLQPYYDWLIAAVHELAEASCGALRVTAAAGVATTVTIAPGRASIGGDPVSVARSTLDLAVHNNATALVYLDAAGSALAVDAQAPPVDPHLPLAEVTLAGGAITSVLDRRFETVFKA